ncbi:hypothetical protein DICPUDRAFT_151347 [Dictyostelium purpureum]|uniref:Uncharacterized protein n=1 Tax=Dictyostelium purpureum TaxID=5786 RepID=F0ZIL1_DICPU|nr:uncharacterized protein DICPUDRAFT_151347 [Dictyostelium purpureum]EGC36206.1 hypothetical protein DICPUDRAFT_151347 [Dictyostelium purpureum]|eukprot:XP_003287273.1 hypothetical protein DICPUDRAFT_151347 [Dictyostelium purpureum]
MNQQNVSVEFMISNLKLLVDSKQYQSAELLGNFIISIPNTQKTAHNNIVSFSLFADTLFGKNEFIRSLKYYKQCLDVLFKVYNNPNLKEKELLLSSIPSTFDSKQFEYDLKYKISICYNKISRHSLALSYLESIPFGSRNFEVHLTISRLYKELGKEKTRECIISLKEALKICPLCIEAIDLLKEIGENVESILVPSISIYQQQMINNSNKNIKKNIESENIIDLSWISLLSMSQMEMKKNSPEKSISLLKKIESKYSTNLYVLEKLALAYLYHDEPSIVNTFNIFQKIRILDPYYVSSMDVFCSLLKRRGLPLELNKVCNDLVTANPNSAETWTSVSLLYFFKENIEKSIENVDRAISINESHEFAHSLRGEILLSLDEPREALPSLERAFQLSKNILTARELVRCHLILNQMREALFVAETINQLSPECSKTMALLGMVLANQPEEREKARKILSKALSLSPHCTDTVLTLSKLNVVEGRFQEAVDILNNQLEYQETDLMHTEIATVYLTKDMHEEAMIHFNSALEINPQYEPASRGLARLEMIMKGIDPDQESIEETDDQEENVEDEDEVEDEEYIS